MYGVGNDKPLYSKKLHILVLRARTNCETSLMIFAFSFGDSVVNHFASLCASLSYLLLREREGENTFNLPLPRQQDQIAASCQQESDGRAASGLGTCFMAICEWGVFWEPEL